MGSGGIDDGEVDTTVGGVVSETVPATVNDHTLLAAKWLPARSVTAVVMVAVYLVPAAKEEVGFSVAVLLGPKVTVAGIVAPSLVCTSVKEEGAVTVEEFIGSLNVATTLEVAETPVAWSTKGGRLTLPLGAWISGPAIP